MFQLRGFGAGEIDCASNPSDPVCVAYYGTTPGPGSIRSGANRVAAAVSNAIATGSIIGTFQNNQQNPQGASTAGANVIVLPSPATSPLATSAGGLANLFSMIPWWVKLGALVGGGFFAYKKWYKPKAG